MPALFKMILIAKILVICSCVGFGYSENQDSSNRKTKCGIGNYFNAALIQCKKCLVCQPGHGVVEACTDNTRCVKCSEGKTFSNVSKFMGSCKNCSQCESDTIISKCNITSDTVCQMESATVIPQLSTTSTLSSSVNNKGSTTQSTNSNAEAVFISFVQRHLIALLAFGAMVMAL